MRSEDFKQRRHDATAEILVEAAESAIARKGYESVTMREIATQAGCALGTLYVYFKSKRELVDEIYERHGRVLFQQLFDAMAATPDPLDRLRQVSRTLLEYFNQNPDVFRLFHSVTPPRPGQTASSLPESIQPLDRKLAEAELQTIRQAQELGEIRQDFSAECIQSFRKGVTMGFLGELTAQEELPSLDEQMRMLWGFQTGGIGARGNHADTAKP